MLNLGLGWCTLILVDELGTFGEIWLVLWAGCEGGGWRKGEGRGIGMMALSEESAQHHIGTKIGPDQVPRFR